MHGFSMASWLVGIGSGLWLAGMVNDTTRAIAGIVFGIIGFTVLVWPWRRFR